MTDRWSKEKRSEVMSRIRCANTQPEMLLRSAVHKKGYRFRLHRKDLPGKPDIVFPKYKAVVFVHGCFWHQHPGCKDNHIPKSNRDYWVPKLERNVQRHEAADIALKTMGWRSLVVWECEIKASADVAAEKVAEFLEKAE